MSISREIFNKGIHVKKFLTTKTFKSVFIAFSAFFLFLGVFNTYAADGEDFTIEPAWDESRKAMNILSGVEPDETNISSTGDSTNMSSLWEFQMYVAPQTSPYYEELVSNAEIPESMKMGAVGMTDYAGNYVYANYPMIDVPENLAQNWVPGYKDSVTGIYAADSGYDVLSNGGIMPLWTKMLNISYVFFVIIMIVAGFMIMFRHKLGGQTMVTIGNVLPNVIFSLVLATFSFAIAGLVIDIGGIAIAVIADILGGEQVGIGSLWQLIGSALINPNTGLTALITGSGGTAGIAGLGITGLITKAGFFGAFTGALGGFGLFAAGASVVAIAVSLIIIGIILVGAIKTLIALYKAYFGLLLNVILAPIQITMGALPGNKHMINNWFLSVLRNVLVFPVVFFIVNLPNAIAAQEGGLSLNFPDKLVNTDAGMQNIDATSGIFIFILRIVVLYFAAQAPKFLEAWFPPNTPKAVGEGMMQAKASLSKVPLVGGLFK